MLFFLSSGFCFVPLLSQDLPSFPLHDSPFSRLTFIYLFLKINLKLIKLIFNLI